MQTIQESVIESVAVNGLPVDFAAYILACIELSGGDRHKPATEHDLFASTMERILNEDLKQSGAFVVATPHQEQRTRRPNEH